MFVRYHFEMRRMFIWESREFHTIFMFVEFLVIRKQILMMYPIGKRPVSFGENVSLIFLWLKI